jgi:hypothetical protein
MVNLTPKAYWELLAVDPDVTKMVAVLTVPQASLDCVTFDFYDNDRYKGRSRDCLISASVP